MMRVFNPLNAELNPICHLLALLGGATIVVVSRLRVKVFEKIVLRKMHGAEKGEMIKTNVTRKFVICAGCTILLGS